MNKNDFRYMLRGKQLYDLKEKDFPLLSSIEKHGTKNERVLLLLHGFSSSPAVYRFLIPQLKNYDAIICPALPGHGESIEAFSQATADQWVSFVTVICEDLFKKYQKVDILGVSLGGLIACKMSERFTFNHMFLLAPALKLRMKIPFYLKLIRLVQKLGFKELRGAAGNILSNKHAEISYRKWPLSPVYEIFNMVYCHQWVAPTCPVDLFLGKHDAVVASLEVEKLFQNLPNAAIHWLDNSAHVLPLDEDLDRIAEVVNSIL